MAAESPNQCNYQLEVRVSLDRHLTIRLPLKYAEMYYEDLQQDCKDLNPVKKDDEVTLDLPSEVIKISLKWNAQLGLIFEGVGAARYWDARIKILKYYPRDSTTLWVQREWTTAQLDREFSKPPIDDHQLDEKEPMHCFQYLSSPQNKTKKRRMGHDLESRAKNEAAYKSPIPLSNQIATFISRAAEKTKNCMNPGNGK